MMTFDEIRANAMRAVSQRSKANADIIRQIEIDYATKQRAFYESELLFGTLAMASAIAIFIYCLIMGA